MIPDSAIEAAHKAWREQAKQDGTIFEYNLRAAIEAAARIVAAEAWDAYESAPYEIRLTADGKNWEPYKENPYR